MMCAETDKYKQRPKYEISMNLFYVFVITLTTRTYANLIIHNNKMNAHVTQHIVFVIMDDITNNDIVLLQ